MGKNQKKIFVLLSLHLLHFIVFTLVTQISLSRNPICFRLVTQALEPNAKLTAPTLSSLNQGSHSSLSLSLFSFSEVDPSYKCFPSELEWSRGALICKFLAPFAEMTNLVSGSSYPTANLYFMQVWKIECWLRANETSDDETICQMVETMKLKFDKYWEDYSDILSIAAVLDPRLKFACLEYCYDTLDPLTSKAKVDHIRKKIKKLYGVYKKDPNSTTASPSEATLVNSIPAGYGDFYAFFSQNAGTGKSALDVYLAEPVLDMAAFKTLDVLRYWKNNATRFKELSRMACDVLSIPITTVSSESSFSAGSRVLSKYRSRLLPSNVQALICGRNWLRGFEVTSDSDEEEEEEEKEGEEKEGEEESGRKKRSK